MAKKENKITEDQLKNVNTQQGQLAEMLKSLGVLEMQKQNLAGRVNELSGEVEKTKAELEEMIRIEEFAAYTDTIKQPQTIGR